MTMAESPKTRKPAPVRPPDDGRVPRCVRVVKSIKNGKVTIYGRKGIYFDGDAAHLWEEHRDSVIPFGPDAFGPGQSE
jgi:hypothetical protein